MPRLLATGPLERAAFVERQNRFVVRYRRGRRTGRAYLANPGRMAEILLPEVDLLLARRPGTRIGVEVVGAAWERRWPGDRPRAVFLNTGRMNALAARLLEARLLPELADRGIVRREPRHGDSRFDFELTGGYLLEVKSVSLVEHGLALFPDAKTERGRRHLEELGARGRGGVLFLVQGHAQRFLPDLHNDLAFARALQGVRGRIDVLAYRVEPSIEPDNRLVFRRKPRRLALPWEALDRLDEDRGLFLLLLDVPRSGAFVHVEAADADLTRRMESRLRVRARPRDEVDALRARAARARALPIRGAADARSLARGLTRIGGTPAGADGQLFRFAAPPLRTAPFQRLLTKARHGI